MKKIIFIVDDSATNLTNARDVLEDCYDVFTMSSAQKMFSLLENKCPHLILLDISMPEMDGFEAIKLLHSDSRFKSIPVIFVTANQEVDFETTGFELGAEDFIRTPFSPQGLLKRVHTQMIIKELLVG